MRLDLIHPLTGGNKWFKLKENLKLFKAGGFNAILSFGGAYSNLIAALAAAGGKEGIRTIGLIRGEPDAIRNPTLSRAEKHGMELHFVTRTEYRDFRDPSEWLRLRERFGNVLILPEGGSDAAGVRGCEAIADLIPDHFNEVALAVGTGATFAGVYRALQLRTRLLGVKVLEANQEELIRGFLNGKTLNENSAMLLNQYTFGGYARPHELLEEFVNQWNGEYEVQIEPVYTGRLFYGVMQLLQTGFFSANKEIILIHTGGMQYLHH